MLISEILERIKQHAKVEKQVDLARALKVEPQNITNYYKRGTIPWKELCDYINEHGLSYDWVFMGSSCARIDCICHDFDDKTKDACKIVKEIMESNNALAKEALRTNLAAFKDHVEQKKKNETIEKRVNHLEELVEAGTLSGTGRAASGTGRHRRRT